ncbi:GumC family protein [Wenxinia marina]|uniref:non-specific protein-tyrosine kinase n=1 Tax=Wenxinia marina DSM 24838 TaxID=1123501 RepID=A0A0D0NHG6_9RHOB|nr:polysaccharide biosynthesis tyrosine autokinase [Wenxinia marina]KIQ67760.1 Uncharacterized protein involved in exopolysaccharide biosynthesis [Wenxinia marina DSM 24838]GGL77458.1 hypothetical protein GCM10011392_34860 [Wenxinia marina]
MTDTGVVRPVAGGPPRRAADPSEVDPRDFLAALWRRKWLVLLWTLAGAVTAFSIVSRIEPRYAARSSVMLDPRSVQVLPAEEVVSDLNLTNPLLDSEAAVLRSNQLLEQVIAGLDDTQRSLLDPRNHPPDLVERIETSFRRVADLWPGLDDTSGSAPAEGSGDQVLSPEEQEMRRLVTALRRSLTIWREGQSYLISIGVETSDPALSADLANRIAAVYIDRQITDRQVAVARATSFLRDRVEDLRSQVEDSEAAIEAFRSSQLATSGIGAEALQQQLLDLSTQHALAQAELASARARHEQIRRTIDAEGIGAAADLLTSPLVLSLREELSALRREDADLATTLGPDHPDRRRLAAAIALVEDDLAAEVDNIVAGLGNEVDVALIRAESLRDTLNGIEGRAADLSSSSLALRQLEREADAARATYEGSLTRYNETLSLDRLQRADARTVERAVPPGAPSGPRIRLFTAFGLVAGLSIGLIAAVLSFVGARGFTRPTEVEAVCGVPVLTALPRQRWRTVERMLDQLRMRPYQIYAERMRHLRLLVEPRGGAIPAASGPTGRTLVITSSVAGEGKTTTSVALAYIEGLAGRSVVYVDFDTRRSQITRDLALDTARPGLGDYLRGRARLGDVLQHSGEWGFAILPMLRPDPGLNDEIGASRLQEVLQELSARFEIVVLDTPPILAVTDASPLVRLADQTLLLVKSETTGKSAVREAVRLLDDQSPNVSIVFTHMDPRQERSTYGGRADGYL